MHLRNLMMWRTCNFQCDKNYGMQEKGMGLVLATTSVRSGWTVCCLAFKTHKK